MNPSMNPSSTGHQVNPRADWARTTALAPAWAAGSAPRRRRPRGAALEAAAWEVGSAAGWAVASVALPRLVL